MSRTSNGCFVKIQTIFLNSNRTSKSSRLTNNKCYHLTYSIHGNTFFIPIYRCRAKSVKIIIIKFLYFVRFQMFEGNKTMQSYLPCFSYRVILCWVTDIFTRRIPHTRHQWPLILATNFDTFRAKKQRQDFARFIFSLA